MLLEQQANSVYGRGDRRKGVCVGKKVRFTIEFDERELIVDELEAKAKLLDITVSQLIKRFIADAMESDDLGPGVPGETLEDFLVKNGALTECPPHGSVCLINVLFLQLMVFRKLYLVNTRI